MAKRRRGSRSARAAGRRPSSRHRGFEELVAEALEDIPMPFAAALDEVAIVIDDEPSADQLRENDMHPDETLYGLYEGVARTEYAADWIMVPNRITLFRLPLVVEGNGNPVRVQRIVHDGNLRRKYLFVNSTIEPGPLFLKCESAHAIHRHRPHKIGRGIGIENNRVLSGLKVQRVLAETRFANGFIRQFLPDNGSELPA